MTRLRACYPQRVADAEHWKAMVSRFWEECQDLDPDLLRQAFDGSWARFPDWFPSLGQLRQLVTETAKRLRDAPRLALEEPRSELSPAQLAEWQEMKGRLGIT